MRFVEALDVTVEEVLVLQFLCDDHIRHRDEHRRVGGRLDVDVLVCHRGARVGAARVDANHARALFAGVLQIFERARAKVSVARGPAPKQDHLGVGVVDRISPGGTSEASVIAKGVLKGERFGLSGDVAPGLGAAAEHVEQSLNGVAVVEQGSGATAGRVEYRRGPVFLPDSQHGARHFVERLVPGDALELARSALAGAPHRVLEPVGMVNPLFGREASHAGKQRRHFGVPLSRLRADLYDFAVANVGVDDAAPSAPGGARAGDDALAVCLLSSWFLVDCRRDHEFSIRCLLLQLPGRVSRDRRINKAGRPSLVGISNFSASIPGLRMKPSVTSLSEGQPANPAKQPGWRA